MLFSKFLILAAAVVPALAVRSSCDTSAESETTSLERHDYIECKAHSITSSIDVEINAQALKIPPANDVEQNLDHVHLKPSQVDLVTSFVRPHLVSTSTKDSDDDESSSEANVVTKTLSITSISITLTKPLVGWSTLPGPEKGSTLPWFTDSMNTLETTTVKETTSMAAAEETADETTSSTTAEVTESPIPAKKKALYGGQIAGIVIGTLAVAAVLLCLGCFALKSRRQDARRRMITIKDIRVIGRPHPDPTTRGSQSYFDISNDSRELVVFPAWLSGSRVFTSRILEWGLRLRQEQEQGEAPPEEPIDNTINEIVDAYGSSVYSQESEPPRQRGNPGGWI
ncbi:hypothetical protein NW762_010016 [Fusarium torreyae]|uniref:Mid2 domain-containing protein n=1 Tax=Fusarium torreyae TaxID=1237075 RepID=A0A9W8RWF7_9HYPO|nr:hypothetical protein NW762_010016 [Fusarium torreyae]